MPIKMDGWVFKSTTLKPIQKVRLTVYDKNNVEDYSEIIGSNPNTELEQALRFFRKLIYGIISVDKINKKITIAGKYGSDFSVGEKIIIRDSTGNDGMYTVSNVLQGVDSTTLTLVESLPDSTADGIVQKRS